MTMTLPKSDTQAHAYDEPDQDFGYLVATASELDLPDGLNAEVLGGNIVVSPWSKAYYTSRMRSVVRQLNQNAPEGHEAGTEPLLFTFPTGGALGPDIHVADVDLLEIDSNQVPGEALSLVAELTSPATRDIDFSKKIGIYGRAGVPVYLLFDMKEQVLTVYSDPTPKRGYQSQVSVEFGEPVHVPEPFGFELDTASFKR